MAEPTGIVGRTLAAIRYAATGNAPADWFGPGKPLLPQAPEAVRGRAFDYQVSINLNYQPRRTEPVSFAKLRTLADNCNQLRMVMQRQIDLLKAIEWTVKPKEKKAPGATADTSIAAIIVALERPDRIRDWPQWLNAMLEQLFVYDAVSIYSRPTQGGGLYSLELLDGATITPLLDQTGRAPMAPDAAYQQILKGLPAVNYTVDELIYYPEHYRVDRVYGYSRVEQMVTIAETTISRLKSQQSYFDYGNVGDGYFVAPPDMVPEQISQLETLWNDAMANGPVARRKVPYLPSGTEWKPTKTDVLSDEFDEWLMRLACFPFGVSPVPFMKQTGIGHGGADTQQEAAQEGGLQPVLEYIRRLMNRIIAEKFKRPDLEFSWVEDREFDPKVAADIDDIRLKNGSRTIDEVRDRNGEAPLPNGMGAVPLIFGTAMRLEDAVKEPAPPPDITPKPGTTTEPEGGDPSTAAAEDDNAQADDVKKKPDAELAKAAKASAIKTLESVVAAYLAAKAIEIADTVVTGLDLAKAKDTKIEAALDAYDWNWDDFPDEAWPPIAGIAVPAGTEAVSEFGLFDKATLKRVTERATTFAKERAAELVGMKLIDGEWVTNPDAAWSISETTRDMLRGVIAEGMERGDSTADLRKAIIESTAFDSDRAENIARTEAAIADVQGQIAGWKESGVVAGKQWVAAPDCCDLCQEYDGQIVGIDEDFPEGDVPLHPQCRCDVIAVLPEDMPDADTETATEE